MAIKFSEGEIIVTCNICGKVVYSAVYSGTTSISDYSPKIQETYKVYCETCYMKPLIKIKNQIIDLQALERKLDRKEKRIDKMVKKDREKILSDYEFY